MNKLKTTKFLQWLLLVVLLGVLCFTVWEITQDVFLLSRAGVHRAHRNAAAQMPPEQIQVWMTFRYINLVFHLPENYLKTELNISDKHYPNISLNVLAKEQNKTSAAELLAVQQAIKAQ